MKDEFLATVSHELRTPLNAIIGWSHMLRSRTLDEPTIARALDTIERNARSQAQLVEDILDVSRVITGQLALKTAPVDLATVINSSIDSVQLAAESKDIHLEVALEAAARHTRGDAARLQQVVWNLLSNAIKFTSPGGRVEVRLERAGNNVRIKVSDTGQGINPEFLPFIFDRFRQQDSSTTRRYGGLGLGLAIVRHLVELHGGIVEANSAGLGLGTTFTVILPLINEKTSKVRFPISAWNAEATGVIVKSKPTLNDVKILLVDDDTDTLQILTMMLKEHGAKVQSARSVPAAMDVLEWFEPDIVVSDLVMPGEDGCSLITKLRSRKSYKAAKVPAIALTSYVSVDERMQALSAGFNMFVPKPVQPDELVASIANLVGF
jgi:CheY-like chemotaxis protein/two-component sensor histidine kinase